MSRLTAFGLVCIVAALWLKRAEYHAGAEQRVLYAAELGRKGPPVLAAQSTGPANRGLFVAMLDCGTFPDAEARVLLGRQGFTEIQCEDSKASTTTKISDAPLLAAILDP